MRTETLEEDLRADVDGFVGVLAEGCRVEALERQMEQRRLGVEEHRWLAAMLNSAMKSGRLVVRRGR